MAKEGVAYRLNPLALREALRGSKRAMAVAMAHDLAVNPEVLAVVLFGSLARGVKGGDIDFLVVVRSRELDDVRAAVELFEKYGLAVDVVSVSLKRLSEVARQEATALVRRGLCL